MEIEVPAAPATTDVQAPDLPLRKRQRKPDRSSEAVQAAQARAGQAHIERMRAAVKKPSAQKAKPAAAPEARPRRNAPIRHWEVSALFTCNW